MPYENGAPVLPDDGLVHLIVTPTTERLEHAATPIDTEAPAGPSGSVRNIALGVRVVQTTTPESGTDGTNDRSINSLDELEALSNALGRIVARRHAERPGRAVLRRHGRSSTMSSIRRDNESDRDATPTDAGGPAANDPSPRQRQLDALAALPPEASMTEQLRAFPASNRSTPSATAATRWR
ncbi:MAG: hypothetical protein R2710_01295 [Acidimicrobiales bacterium]